MECEEEEEEVVWEVSDRREELRRKSCVIAMPIEAKERDVRSQARKVRSVVRMDTWLAFFFFYSLSSSFLFYCLTETADIRIRNMLCCAVEISTYPTLNGPVLRSLCSPTLRSPISPRTRPSVRARAARFRRRCVMHSPRAFAVRRALLRLWCPLPVLLLLRLRDAVKERAGWDRATARARWNCNLSVLAYK